MQAVILAGGLGTRLQSVVNDVPKPMAQVGYRPFLEYLLDYWIAQGVTQFYFSVCHLAEKIIEHFDQAYKGVPIEYIQEPSLLKTGGAILYAMDHIENKQSDILILNGDTFVQTDLKKLYAFHKEKKAKMTLLLREVSSNDRYSGVALEENGLITKFCERKEGSRELLINAGVYLTTPHFILSQKWAVQDIFSLEDEFFPEVISQKSLYGFITQGKFIDIGIPSDYQKSEAFFEYVKTN